MSKPEKNNALLCTLLIAAAALSTAIMISSFIPFLASLGDPEGTKTALSQKGLTAFERMRSDRDLTLSLGAICLIAIIASNLIQFTRAYYVTNFTSMTGHNIAKDLFSSYLRMPYTEIIKIPKSEIEARILLDSEQVSQFFYRPICEIISGAITSTAILIVLLATNFMAAIASTVISVALYLSFYRFGRAAAERFGRVRSEANVSKLAIANEAFGGISEVKLLGLERRYIERFNKFSLRSASSEAKAIILSALPQYGMYMIVLGGAVALIISSIEMDTTDKENLLALLPTLGAFAIGGQRLIPEVSKIYYGLIHVKFSKSIILKIYDQVGAATDSRTTKALPKASRQAMHEEIALNSIYLKNPETGKNILQDVSLRLRPGERIGLVGPSGSGKTKLAEIICGLITPSSGSIYVDQKEMFPENAGSWHKSISFVRQTPFIFLGNIAENVTISDTENNHSAERLKKSIIAADICDLTNIITSPQKHIESRSKISVSGGQAQKISIARALYRDTNFIILDEPTSALDTISEQHLLKAISSLPREKTLLIISHRLNPLKICDRILVLEAGRIVADGSMDYLMSKSSIFRKLVEADNSSPANEALHEHTRMTSGD